MGLTCGSSGRTIQRKIKYNLKQIVQYHLRIEYASIIFKVIENKKKRPQTFGRSLDNKRGGLSILPNG